MLVTICVILFACFAYIPWVLLLFVSEACVQCFMIMLVCII